MVRFDEESSVYNTPEDASGAREIHQVMTNVYELFTFGSIYVFLTS